MAEMVKVWFDCDEYYPFWELSEEPNWPEAYTCMELSRDEWLDYQDVMRRFAVWQERIQKADNTRKIHPREIIKRPNQIEEWPEGEGPNGSA